MENQNERTQEALDLQKYIQDKAKAEQKAQADQAALVNSFK